MAENVKFIRRNGRVIPIRTGSRAIAAGTGLGVGFALAKTPLLKETAGAIKFNAFTGYAHQGLPKVFLNPSYLRRIAAGAVVGAGIGYVAHKIAGIKNGQGEN